MSKIRQNFLSYTREKYNRCIIQIVPRFCASSGGISFSSSSSSSSSRLFLLNGSRNIINAGSFSSSSSIRGNSHFFSRTNEEEEEEEARRTRRRGYGSTIPSTSYETRGRGEGGGRLRREQLGNTSRNRFCFSTCTFLARGRGAAAAAAEQEQQREQLDDATTTAETTVKPKRKTKKQLKEDEFISNVLVPGLRRFYAEFKHLNVPKGYEFSKDGEVEEEEKKEEEEERADAAFIWSRGAQFPSSTRSSEFNRSAIEGVGRGRRGDRGEVCLGQ